MRWYEATLCRQDAYTEDKLGHPVVDEVEFDTCIVRKAPVKAVEGDIEGNRYRTMRRTFLSPRQPHQFIGVSSMRVCGVKYQLENVTSLENGHTMLTCVHCKPEAEHAREDHCQGL